MSNTRREFLHNTAALTAGIASGVTTAALAASLYGEAMIAAPSAMSALIPTPSTPDANIHLPTMKFGTAEISRMVLGVNPLYGFAHYNIFS